MADGRSWPSSVAGARGPAGFGRGEGKERKSRETSRAAHQRRRRRGTTQTGRRRAARVAGSARKGRRRSGASRTTGRGGGCAARRPGAPGGASSARRSTDVSNRGRRRLGLRVPWRRRKARRRQSWARLGRAGPKSRG
jgi:hypothetical protein